MADEKLCKHKESCVKNACKGLVVSFLQSLAAKSAFHIVFQFLLKRGYKNPVQCLLKLISLDTLKFVGFASLMNFLYKATLCAMRNYRKKEDGLNHIVAGAVGGLSIAFEDQERRETWALYFFARFIDVSLRKGAKKYLPNTNVNNIEMYLFMIMIVFNVYCYGKEKDILVKSYYNFLKSVFSPSKAEQSVMNAWSAESAIRMPLNK
ncbi:unnamed protein product [Blepharisma stoltei]|uniref:Peroxisomal membrane protein 4 n=1 Tax=Blepharisma stoltei TaxID=1481888 RepID=A0AAU9JSV3_9CILI|nr:unnamed protein product [Blepharisma stoltei]